MTGVQIDLAEKRFGDHHVLGAIEFSLAEGEVACLLGPSGVGKSTLLAIAAGIETDFSGRVQTPDGPVAMVFQEPRLLPWRTLAENIALIPGSGGLARAEALLSRVGLGDAATAYPQKVSLGMQRRAALARALAVRPALVLMDEPLVSLDTDTADEMRALIRDVLAETGATAIIATHDRREALGLADRVLEIGGQPARLLRDRVSPLEPAARRDPARIEALVGRWFAMS